MKITHKLPKLSISKDGCKNPICILSNRKGGFLLLSDPVISKYNGLFINDGFQLYKIIEDIGIDKSSFKEIENNLTLIKRKHKDKAENILFPAGINGIIYSLSKKSRIIIDFDCRKVYDLRDFGRIYKIDVEKNRIVVSFTKQTDWRDDQKEGEVEFNLFVVIQPKEFVPEKDYSYLNQWVEKRYEYDYSRKDFPAHRYVYRPFSINAKELLIAAGRTKKKALAELERLKRSKPAKQEFKRVNKKKDQDIAAAFVCAQASLECLKTRHKGITRLYAGFPWFFQLWSRDENVCLGALIRLKQFKTVKAILFEYLNNISKDGRLPNRIPSPHLGSSDGIGWFWKRMGDFIAELKRLRLLDRYISPKDLKHIRTTLADSIKRIEKNYKKDRLIINKSKESWMDTVWDGQDTREGFCIETQALHLNMLRLMHELGDGKDYQSREKQMRKLVVERFWNGDLLADIAGDFTARPNIFIAYYVYPYLLSSQDWQTCFKTALDRLWLDWGGVSTIDKKHSLFTPEYTGKDNQSYHRGDSWFWINNLAALCLFRNNPIEFEDRIIKMIEASSREILWDGAIGHHAEVSPASHLESKGCFTQAWSNSMFIELIMEVYQ